MLISGVWHLCDDGMVRPVVRGEVLAGDGSWVKAPFLLDTGADRTVFSADVVGVLGLLPLESPHRLGGVGGEVASILLQTQIRMTHDEDGKVLFRGQYAGVQALESLDMSVLGRDITNLFAVIVDRPRDLVCLLGQQHQYTISRK